MTTTTLRLTDEMKARVAAAAEASGLSPHGFMLHAIETLTAEAEEQAAFDALTRERLAQYRRTGEFYTLDDVRVWMLARVRGEETPRPKPRKRPPQENPARVRSRAG